MYLYVKVITSCTKSKTNLIFSFRYLELPLQSRNIPLLEITLHSTVTRPTSHIILVAPSTTNLIFYQFFSLVNNHRLGVKYYAIVPNRIALHWKSSNFPTILVAPVAIPSTILTNFEWTIGGIIVYSFNARPTHNHLIRRPVLAAAEAAPAKLRYFKTPLRFSYIGTNLAG